MTINFHKLDVVPLSINLHASLILKGIFCATVPGQDRRSSNLSAASSPSLYRCLHIVVSGGDEVEAAIAAVLSLDRSYLCVQVALTRSRSLSPTLTQRQDANSNPNPNLNPGSAGYRQDAYCGALHRRTHRAGMLTLTLTPTLTPTLPLTLPLTLTLTQDAALECSRSCIARSP